jgi:single-strand DNA-binding protein
MSAPSTLRGRITADPELRFIASGKAVASFSIVTSTKYKDKDSGEWLETDTSFWNCQAWGDMAEMVIENIQKGTSVIAAGKFKQRQYETKEGEKRTVIEFVVDDIGVSLKWKPKASNGNRPAAQRDEDYVPF